MANWTSSDTIVAIATAPGSGGIGVVRLSGAAAPVILGRIFKPARESGEFETHRLYPGIIIDPSDGDSPVDEVLAVRMKAPHSYTGEEVAEIQGHGSPALLARIVAICLKEGARQARPGEFTERAFLSGRIDLSQAEAVADLISARTAQAQRQALEVLRGRLSVLAGSLADRIRRLLAHVEVNIDFTEEDEAPPDLSGIAAGIDEVRGELEKLLAGYREGKLLRDGARVALAGAPNAGKSSLFNALLLEDRALVHDEPGTTRDRLEEWLDIEGIPVRLVDTAGLRDAAGVEGAGVALSRRAIEEAEVLLLVVDATAPLPQEAREILEKDTARVLPLANKMDLPGARAPEGFLPLSARTSEGLPELRSRLAGLLRGGASAGEGVPLIRERHRQAVSLAVEGLGRAAGLLRQGEGAEICASVLRAALAQLSEIAGESTPDDILGLIFSEFCIGK